jgi:hypothetical protein
MEGRNKPMAERTGSTKGKKSMSFATISGINRTSIPMIRRDLKVLKLTLRDLA